MDPVSQFRYVAYCLHSSKTKFRIHQSCVLSTIQTTTSTTFSESVSKTKHTKHLQVDLYSVLRMETAAIPKLASNWTPEGKREKRQREAQKQHGGGRAGERAATPPPPTPPVLHHHDHLHQHHPSSTNTTRPPPPPPVLHHHLSSTTTYSLRSVSWTLGTAYLLACFWLNCSCGVPSTPMEQSPSPRVWEHALSGAVVEKQHDMALFKFKVRC